MGLEVFYNRKGQAGLQYFDDDSYRYISICSPVYDAIKLYYDYAWVNQNGKWGFMTISNDPYYSCSDVTGCVYDDYRAFHDTWAVVKRNGVYSYLSDSGFEKGEFDYATDFCNGYATVTINQKKFKIDKNINIIEEIVEHSMSNNSSSTSTIAYLKNHYTELVKKAYERNASEQEINHILKEYEKKAKAITEQEKRFHALKRIDDITKNL